MDAFITLQARTLLLTLTCTAGHLPPNALLHMLLYQGQPQACNPEKLPIYWHYSGKKKTAGVTKQGILPCTCT